MWLPHWEGGKERERESGCVEKDEEKMERKRPTARPPAARTPPLIFLTPSIPIHTPA